MKVTTIGMEVNYNWGEAASLRPSVAGTGCGRASGLFSLPR
jgi:hypothetical protein